MATAKNTPLTEHETKMRKYIVDGPEPKEGQKASSGGIRQNGKLTAQFKNPVPYEETILPAVTASQKSDVGVIHQEQASVRTHEMSMYLLSLVWQEFGEPVFRSGLRKIKSNIINKIESSADIHAELILSPESELIDVYPNEIETIHDSDGIIHFPTRKSF